MKGNRRGEIADCGAGRDRAPARSTLPFLPETPAQSTWAFPTVPTPDAAFVPVPEEDGRVRTCSRPQVLLCDLG